MSATATRDVPAPPRGRPARTGSFVVISPVRDEAPYFPQTIASMTAQVVRPLRWVIVDDGSRDETPALAAAAARAQPWIHLVRRPRRTDRRVGGGVVAAFREGLRYVADLDYDFLCKLDGDLAFGPRYFERLLSYFASDPKLATLSGRTYVRTRRGLRRERGHPAFSVGAAKFYRRRAFEEIGGFVEEVMWDGIDCHRCRQLGWRAASVDEPDLRLIHLRPMGSSDRSVYRGRLRHGRGQWFMGTHPLYMLASALYRMTEPPYVLGGLCMLAGYLGAALRREPRYGDADFRRHLHRWQLNRLCPWRKATA